MLQAGFSRLDVTPPLGVNLDGYFNFRYAKGYLDPIELNAVAVSDGECRVVMIAADLLGIDMKDVAVIKGLITERTGLDEAHILVSALHQHTSYHLYDQVKKRLPESFAKLLYRKFCDAAVLALDDLSDATLYTGEEKTENEIAFIRRYYLKDGKVVTNPSAEMMPSVVSHCDVSDNVAHVLRFAREGKNDIALVNFSTHPDVIGGEYFSADWPGFTRRFLEADNPGLSCAFFTGAEGDSNHHDRFKTVEENCPYGTRYPHSRYMGRTVADAVNKAFKNMTKHPDGKVFGALNTIYVKSNTSGEEKYEECKATYEAHWAGKLDYKPTGEQLAFARRVINIRENMTVYRPLPIAAVGISDVVVVGFAGEPFADYEREVRRVSNGKFSVTFCLTNGYQGYLPTSKAFSEGGYEAANSHFTSTLEDEAIACVEKMLSENFK